MQSWMVLWTGLLGVSFLAFLFLLVIVGFGAIGELREMLLELREDTAESAAHPEALDEAV